MVSILYVKFVVLFMSAFGESTFLAIIVAIVVTVP
jgi:hypothetical protein